MKHAICPLVVRNKSIFLGYLQKGVTSLQRAAAVLLAVFAFSIPAHAQVTSLTMTSDPGDYIGGGQTYIYTEADGQFGAQVNSDQSVSLSFITPNYTHWWYLDFAAANGVPLTVGTYAGAVRFPFQGANQPGLSVYGDGRGCNTLTGTFQVLEATYGPANDVLSFDAIFEQHCEGSAPALRGEIRYNASSTVTLSAPSNLTAVVLQPMTFTVSATDIQSRHVVLTASGLPAGASFVDNGNNTGTFSWTPTGTQAGNYIMMFQADNQQGNTSFTYTHIQVVLPPPVNDDIDHATVVTSMPFFVTEDASNATTASDDPYSCYTPYQSVWFTYTPQSNARVEVNTLGSNYDTALAVFTGTRGALTQIGCNEDAGGTVNSRVRFDAVAGTTYYVMASSLYPTSNASLVFNVQPAPPAFTFVPTVNQFGTVIPSTGAVSVSGSVVCSVPSYVYITGQVKQVRGGVPITGWFQAAVPCSGTTAWNATVQNAAALFHGRSSALFSGGPATVSASAFAVDPDSGEFKQVNLQANTTLRAK